MRAPHAEFDVHVQSGARTNFLVCLIPAARSMEMLPRELLADIARKIRNGHDNTEVIPPHRNVPFEDVPEHRREDYQAAYTSLHEAIYHGIWVRYGFKAELHRIVLISMAFAPVLGRPKIGFQLPLP